MNNPDPSSNPTAPEQPADKGLLESPCSPVRIQRRRSRAWKMPANTVSVCRPAKWGNPFKIGKDAWDIPRDFRGQCARDATHAVELYRAMIRQYGLPIGCDLSELRGKNLACWCKEGTPCHADVLLDLANVKVHTPLPASDSDETEVKP